MLAEVRRRHYELRQAEARGKVSGLNMMVGAPDDRICDSRVLTPRDIHLTFPDTWTGSRPLTQPQV